MNGDKEEKQGEQKAEEEEEVVSLFFWEFERRCSHRLGGHIYSPSSGAAVSFNGGWVGGWVVKVKSCPLAAAAAADQSRQIGCGYEEHFQNEKKKEKKEP